MAIDCLQTGYLSADDWTVKWVTWLAGQVSTELPQCTVGRGQVKIGKSQKQILKFSFEPKTIDFFCISALASKSGRIKKI